jgi:hypothetical protein
MKRALIVLATALSAATLTLLAQQPFDFKMLDKLGANAKESTNITLDGNTLKLASSVLGDGKDSVKSVVNGLKGIYIRNYEFEKEGQYNAADLEPLRTYLKSGQWNKIVDVKETKETSEIYVQPLPNDQLGGLAIISAEAKEVSVILISGVLKMSDVAKLSGNLGIPDITLTRGGKKSDK